MEKKNLCLSDLFTNVGQIAGLPPNPRLIKDEKFEALKKSLTDDPEMLDLRELIVYPNPDEKGTYVVIGGNMRYNAPKNWDFRNCPARFFPNPRRWRRCAHSLSRTTSPMGNGTWICCRKIGTRRNCPTGDWTYPITVGTMTMRSRNPTRRIIPGR